MYEPSVYVLFTLISLSSTAIVKWVPNLSFNMPTNYKDGHLPCSKQTVVFEETISAAVKIESDVAVYGMILPNDGELIIDGTIAFGADDKDNCTDSGNVYYKQQIETSWLQPDVWSSDKFNAATPDAERIPCYDDDVVFPKQNAFTVYLPETTQYVRTLSVNGRSYGTVYFKIQTSIGYVDTQFFILNTKQDTGVAISQKNCYSRAGCPCQDVLKVDCSTKFCPMPKCFDPVQPLGHCCHICGGFLTFHIEKSFDLIDFTESVAKAISPYGENKLVYHIGRLPSDLVQVVVVDKDEYDGTSSEVVNDIKSLTYKHGGSMALTQTSGSPLSKAGLGGKIAVSMFFGVILVMGAIYAYYYKLPEFRLPTMARNSGGRGLLRFNRRTESVVSLTRRDSTATIGSIAGTAFRNPLYDSKRDRVQVAEPVAEE